MSTANSKVQQKRKPRGASFKPGQSGNPSGRPKKTPEQFELEAACRAKTPDALAVITNLMATARQDSVRLAAATAIIERGHGKPIQRAEVRTGPLDTLEHEDLRALRDAINSLTPGAAVASGAERTTH